MKSREEGPSKVQRGGEKFSLSGHAEMLHKVSRHANGGVHTSTIHKDQLRAIRARGKLTCVLQGVRTKKRGQTYGISRAYRRKQPEGRPTKDKLNKIPLSLKDQGSFVGGGAVNGLVSEVQGGMRWGIKTTAIAGS